MCCQSHNKSKISKKKTMDGLKECHNLISAGRKPGTLPAMTQAQASIQSPPNIEIPVLHISQGTELHLSKWSSKQGPRHTAAAMLYCSVLCTFDP
jgi:hypothetical protein